MGQIVAAEQESRQGLTINVLHFTSTSCIISLIYKPAIEFSLVLAPDPVHFCENEVHLIAGQAVVPYEYEWSDPVIKGPVSALSLTARHSTWLASLFLS